MIGIGVDIEEIIRFKNRPYKKNRAFYGNIFTKRELAYCLSHKNPYPHFAGRFAAKEAVIKALGEKVSMKKIEIVNKRSGQPYVKFQVSSFKFQVKISLSHTDEYAVAVAAKL